MKSLFDENDRYTRDGEAVCIEKFDHLDSVNVYSLLDIVFKRWMVEGYSAREIAHCLHWAVSDCELNMVMDSNRYPREP